MKEQKQIIQKIEKHYVGEDCIQATLQYRDSITILDKNGILYHHLEGSHLNINKYISDNRRLLFPYNNIPTYYTRKGLIKYNNTKQLFNYEEPYIEVRDWQIIENFVIKDNDTAILIKTPLSSTKTIKYMTRIELEKMFINTTSNQELFTMRVDNGAIIPAEKVPMLYKKEEEIVEILQEGLKSSITRYRQDALERKVGIPYFCQMETACLEKMIENITIEDIPMDLALDNENVVIIKTDGHDIIIQKISVKFMSINNYQVTITDIPVTKYTLEQIKDIVTKLTKIKGPRIPLYLNPKESNHNIEESKKLIKRKYK